MAPCKKCDEPAQARGLCSRHYCDAYYYGEFEPKPQLPRGMSVADKLAMRSTSDPSSGCILWNGAKTRKGYGSLGFNGRSYTAHRLAWEQVHGEIPTGMHVCHHCDNPSCINPSHLFLGTNSDNVRDKVSKGRQARVHGEASPSAVLTESQVRAIRGDARKPRFIATDYGITAAYVWEIKSRRSWAHIR